jgi:hypothetical protein
MTTDKRIYRELADAGNEHAKHILDAGVIPDAEMDPAVSSSDVVEGAGAEEAETLAEFARKVGALKAEAEILAAAGDYKGAAEVHMRRADQFYWRDQHAEAMHAYKDAASAYAKHADAACARLTPEQIRAWKAGETAEGDG